MSFYWKEIDEGDHQLVIDGLPFVEAVVGHGLDDTILGLIVTPEHHFYLTSHADIETMKRGVETTLRDWGYKL